MGIDDKLRNLRRAMTSTAFKDFDVDKQKLKNKVMEQSRQGRYSFHQNKLKRWYVTVLSIAGVVLLVLYIGVTGLSDQFAENPGQNNNKVILDGNSTEQLNNASHYKDKKKELVVSKEYPDKFEIVNKMFHSLKYIDSAQGKFVWGYPKDNAKVRQEFYFDFNLKKSLSQVSHIKNGKVEKTELTLRNEESLIRKLKEKNVFTKVPINEIGSGTEPLKQKYLASSSFVTNSEWFILIYNNYKNWTYEESTVFGMPVYVIKGTISENKSETLKGSFTMIVSKETGVLLDLKRYDYQHNLKFFITVENIQINHGIANDVFTINVDDSKKISWDDYQIKVIKGTNKNAKDNLE